MSKTKNSQKKYICCRYCMDINPKLLIPCAKYRDNADFNLQACPKKDRKDPNSKKLKPKWEDITETEFLKIYELSKALKANTDTYLRDNNNKIYHLYLKRVPDKNSNS